jgi:competence protein ComEC
MLIVYDLGYGSGAACFSAGRDGAVLMDCGDRRGFKRIVAPSLRRLGIEPDSVVISHADGTHLGGGGQVWTTFPIRQALMPVELSRSPTYQVWMGESPGFGVALRMARAGDTVRFPDQATLEVIHAPDPLAKNARADERVAVFRLHWRGWKLLFTSDAGMSTELKLLDAGKDVAADVIIAGRNRSDISICDRFLDAVRPKAIIASNPTHPPEEMIPPRTLEYWRSQGIHVIDQRESGGVTVTVDEDGSLRIEGFLGPAPVLLRRD